jgi:hypothetical protein
MGAVIVIMVAVAFHLISKQIKPNSSKQSNFIEEPMSSDDRMLN